jgi:hypothetical protein
MNLKRTLTAIATIVADEAARNPAFRSRIEDALGVNAPEVKAANKSLVANKPLVEEKRRGGRRTAALLDPVDLAKHGEGELRTKLSGLDLERLLDVVAEFGMDPGKLVMKWKDRERIIDRIVEIALARSTKGDAFRQD